ncbi:DUF4864 domain-containing protein [Ramlibacter sp.]|uniref:DUF4864 domain-containing protein n=1 Tax=Ramlibacter sp. TaxID=1917967 RepID=UPI002FCA31CF
MPHQPFPQPFIRSPHQRGHRRSKAATAWSLLFTAVLLGGVFASDLPQAAAPKSVSSQVVQEVVQQQLKALAVEDAASAFALADPGMRTQFGNAEAFLDTVRQKYPMLLRPASVLYLKPETDGTIAMQKVRVTDDNGAAWSLTYLLNRQQDNQWRISGCVVTAEGQRILA